MRKMRTISRWMMLVLALTMVLTMAASAEETGSIWMRAAVVDGGVEVAICADTVLSSGVVTVTYDSKNLTFDKLVLEEEYVAAHAINSKTKGVLKISWIAPADASAEEAYVLMRLQFSGEGDVTVNSQAFTVTGETVQQANLNLSALEQGITQATALEKEDYTQETWAILDGVLDQSKKLLAKETLTPQEVEEAIGKLTLAMEQLEFYVPPTEPPTEPPTQPSEPTQPSQPTQPTQTEPTVEPTTKPTEPAQTQPNPTQPGAQDEIKPGNGWLIAAVAVLAVAALGVGAVVFLKIRGNR